MWTVIKEVGELTTTQRWKLTVLPPLTEAEAEAQEGKLFSGKESQGKDR